MFSLSPEILRNLPSYLYLHKMHLFKITNLLVAYAVTLIAVTSSIYFLKFLAPSSNLSTILTFFLICSLATGIEPGHIKSAMIETGLGHLCISEKEILETATLKAVGMAPVLSLVWWFTSSSVLPGTAIVVLTFIATLTGFITSEYRARHDFEGRFAQAIWLKQGSLSLAIIGAVTFSFFNFSLLNSLYLASGLRVIWFILLKGRFNHSGEISAHTKSSIATSLRSLGWRHVFLISLLAALSGSIDRIAALKLLSAQDAAAYIIMYELVSKVWLFPYMASPIVFAKRSRTGQGRALRQAIYINVGILALGGTVFAGSLGIAANMYERFGIDPILVGLMYAAFAINSVSQLVSTDLQASGESRALVALSAKLFAISIPVFGVSALYGGLQGMGVAWVIKSLLEFIALSAIKMDVRSLRKIVSDFGL